MTTAHCRPLRIGGTAPDIPCRTDEGTPVSLSDFNGHAIAVFLCGPLLDRFALTLITLIRTHRSGFVSGNCSPLVISGEDEASLSALRDLESLPFLTLSDPDLSLHAALCDIRDPRACPGAWIFDDRGILTTVLQSLPPRDLVDAVLRRTASLS
jgi:peroxiredoxin